MCALFALALPLLASSAPPPHYGVSAIQIRDGYPVFTVNGKPFFIWGASFFYERTPRAQWASSLAALRGLGVNTLDLYVPWNWHEISDGTFDFTGRTDARRDLRGLLQLGRRMGFYFVIRPGPVIRNEWRNGGYPAWLLKRPEYGMPLHDVLQGRYPATATLQNANSDDAAAEWMRNRTHVRYAQLWLRRALQELRPVADRILAIQLDDDQGAYLTNQTWPAPHLRAYLLWLERVVHEATSERVPVFINTYDMKVPASSPVWTMGNWYQSDAKRYEEHDRMQLLLSTSLLGTRPRQPIVLSEFQAGWLLAPEAIYPRASDPSNTLLALHTALDAGARGVIDFPMQDTLSPAGWEAPFANRFYAWDAALRADGTPSPRYAPTREFGKLVARDGTLLAATHPVADAAILWWPSALASPPSRDRDILTVADATLDAQRSCVAHELTCVLVDLEASRDTDLRRYRALIVPRLPSTLPASPAARLRLSNLGHRMPVLRSLAEPRARSLIAARTVRGLPGATLHAGRVAGKVVLFLDAVNLRTTPVDAIVHVRYPPFARDVRVRLAPRSASLVRLDAAEQGSQLPPAATPRIAPGVPIRRDVDVPIGDVGSVVLQSSTSRVVIAPYAGGRAFVFEDLLHGTNAFTTVGALRDDVSLQPPRSTTDRIAAYTHTFPAGTFNRTYAATRLSARSVRLTYDAPDVIPHGARFEKTVTLDGSALRVRERLVPRPGGDRQRLVVRSSIAVGVTDATPWQPPLLLPSLAPLRPSTTTHLSAGEPLALYDSHTHELAIVTWRKAAVESARLDVYDRDAVLRVQYAPGWHSTTYRYSYVRDLHDALARLRRFQSGTER